MPTCTTWAPRLLVRRRISVHRYACDMAPENHFSTAARFGVGAAGLLSMILTACGSSSQAGLVAPADAAPAAEGATPEMEADASDDANVGSEAQAAMDATAADDGAAIGDGAAMDVAAADSSADAGALMSVYVTFYGWADNSPPGGAIAYPRSDGYSTVHDAAGGAGTYADPITFATDKAEFPVGTILYVPFIEKYVIMEDDCVECDSDWTSAHKWHIDVWMNSNGTESSSSLASCEDRWTRDSTPVELGPPPGRSVTSAPLFVPSTNTCRMTP
jgi:3D (Asp-Asp-Asp) domain-containing protein